MTFQTLKTGFLVAVLSTLLAACSSTSTEDGAGADGMSGSGVGTGTAGDGSAYGDDLGAGGVATVFYFEFDKAVLTSEARAALDIHAQRLRGGNRQVRLEGHADERGTREYNMALGERRANAVKEYLTLQGVNAANLEVISYGEERPAQLGSDDQSWSLNRRVEMK
ncbi:MAG: peptidoglycan-associated lipoprotein Pal [Porticoccaceae bacterium]|jgi:peptidoglycan-associated lipoprotein|nr:peptidoglycan-associated lipoprotein Pal [Porticoccaceae bacterium]MEA3301559.1 peptidoglycan-associated lipoprotein Pal [Pseudomonadota bacterium]HLS98840.1 peptidoglycan-associated lipoprotein Pal [Porticoccaceae bacterium]